VVKNWPNDPCLICLENVNSSRIILNLKLLLVEDNYELIDKFEELKAENS
jgi:hypothetical protein